MAIGISTAWLGRMLGVSVLLLLLGSSEALRIAAFNIQIFGVTKFAKEDVVATLSKVVCVLRVESTNFICLFVEGRAITI